MSVGKLLILCIFLSICMGRIDFGLIGCLLGCVWGTLPWAEFIGGLPVMLSFTFKKSYAIITTQLFHPRGDYESHVI